MNNPPEGVTDRTIRRVVCAAIRAADGDLLLGIRHYSQDMYRQIAARSDGHKFIRRHDEDQGFVDQWGQWLSREYAYHVAVSTDRLTFPDECGYGLESLCNPIGTLCRVLPLKGLLSQWKMAMNNPRDPKEMTPAEMYDYAGQVYAILEVTEQESEAKAVYRLGEFIRELGRRIDLTTEARIP